MNWNDPGLNIALKNQTKQLVFIKSHLHDHLQGEKGSEKNLQDHPNLGSEKLKTRQVEQRLKQFVVGWSLETYSSLYFTEKSWGFMIFMCKACMSQRFRSRPRTHTHKITQTRPLEQSARTSFKHSIYVPQNIRRNSLASMSVSLWILLMFGSHPIGMYPLTGFTMFHLDSQVLQDICQFI